MKIRFRVFLLICFFAVCTAVVYGQDTDTTADSVRSAFPGFLSPKAKATHVMQSVGEIRKAVPMSTSTISPNANVFDASTSHTLAMQWGDAIEVQAVICDKETIGLVEKSISDRLTQDEFQTGIWDSRGFLKAQREKYALLFRTPPPSLWESFHLIVKLDGQPKELTEYIMLIYDVEAGPRPRHEPPPDRDWFSVTDTQAVEKYINLNLSKSIRDAALQTIKNHCSKVKSDPAPKEDIALQQVDTHVSPEQSRSIRQILERKKQ